MYAVYFYEISKSLLDFELKLALINNINHKKENHINEMLTNFQL